MAILIGIILFPIILKVIWVLSATYRQGRLDKEEKEIIRRANYLISKVVTEPEQLFNEMPRSIGPQFQGEWALYSCSMLSAALVNTTLIYGEDQDRHRWWDCRPGPFPL